MDVLVFVVFADMQPDTERHERARDHELRRHQLTKKQHSDCRAKEQGNREIGGGSRRPWDDAEPGHRTSG